MIEIDNLRCSFGDTEVLSGIQLKIMPGTFTAVLGSNGSGKSTLARHLNAILIPQSGTVTVDGMSTDDDNLTYDIRERVGMVFQNPESQAVALVVEDDTAFAPENLGLDEEETAARIEYALRAAGIGDMRHRTISTLSGGQKQLTAIAGILAMRPGYMVFDEASSMLDPSSRAGVLECVKRLQKEHGLAVIWITHYMDEAAEADRVVVIDGGKIAADGSPREVFSDYALISRAGLELPAPARIAHMLAESGYNIEEIPLNENECVSMLKRLINRNNVSLKDGNAEKAPGSPDIKLKNISYTYRMPDGDVTALRGVSAEIKSGMITAIIGSTGSGKSTLMEIIGGITKPDSGEALAGGMPASTQRGRIGMVFQYPEYQLFEETVYDDIAFGVKKLGISGKELHARIIEAANKTGLKEEQLRAMPIILSGGQQRMAAIAGILAMKPEILLLDEPAAGLDPAGRRRVFAILEDIIRDNPKMTIIFVTHSMEDAAEYAKEIILLDNGRLAAHGSPREVFSQKELLEKCGLSAPVTVRIADKLRECGADIGSPLTAHELCRTVCGDMEGGGSDTA